MNETVNKFNRVRTKNDMVTEEIMSMISQGKFKEGEKLPPEQYFSDYFGVSRVTIRESFKALHMLGLVDIQQGRGTFVRRPDMETLLRPLFSSIILNELDIHQLYDARMFVESGTAYLAAQNCSEEGIESLKMQRQQMREVVEAKDAQTFNHLDIDFHLCIGELSKNQILLSMYRTIKNVLDRYISTSNLSMKTVVCSVEYHEKIIDAIIDRKAEQARLLMAEHVAIARDDLITRLKENGIPRYIKLE